MTTHASPPFTPAQLIDAGRRAEAQDRPDLAIQFYRALTEHFGDAPEAAQAHGALGRIGAWPSGGAPQAAALRRQLASGPDPYAGGRALARLFGILGWLVVVGATAGFPAYLLTHAEPLSRADLLPMAGGAAGSLILGFGVVLAAQIARAQFDRTQAARDLVAIERARLGLD